MSYIGIADLGPRSQIMPQPWPSENILVKTVLYNIVCAFAILVASFEIIYLLIFALTFILVIISIFM